MFIENIDRKEERLIGNTKPRRANKSLSNEPARNNNYLTNNNKKGILLQTNRRNLSFLPLSGYNWIRQVQYNFCLREIKANSLFVL